MRSGRYLAMTAAAMIAAAPAMAAPVNTAPVANPAASLSVASNLRTGSHGAHKSKLVGLPLIAALVAGAAVVATVAVVASNSGSN